MDLNQLKIIDGKLFLDNTEVKGIQKINLQKGIDEYKTSLKIEMIVESQLDELDSKSFRNNWGCDLAYDVNWNSSEFWS